MPRLKHSNENAATLNVLVAGVLRVLDQLQ
jgi:hypothetical protein